MNTATDRTMWCTAKGRDQSPCRFRALQGLPVCRIHAGQFGPTYERALADDPNRTPADAMTMALHRTAGQLIDVRAVARQVGVDTSGIDKQIRDALSGAA